MAGGAEDYAMVCEVLRKMNLEESYRPNDYEQKVVANFLKEDKPSHKRIKKETRNIQQIVHDRISRQM
jgi:hypothetical protein